MDLLIVLLLAPLAGLQFLKAREQRQRIQLLGHFLAQYQIEQLMQTLLDGYMRALDEQDAERRQAIWSTLSGGEEELARQCRRLADDVSKVWSEQTQVSTLPWTLPYATRLFPRKAFDLRHALALHADGIRLTADNVANLSPRDKAFQMTAEVLLLQHTCHWFCRSRAVASARMVARHQVTQEKLVASVSRATQLAYGRLIGLA
jgi:hypothetical protein